MNRTFVIADYYGNQALYAKNCENKAIAVMHCNGKCQMMKKLKQEETKDEENPERKSENKNEVVSFGQLNFQIYLQHITTLNRYRTLQQSIPDNFSKGLFHPPQC